MPDEIFRVIAMRLNLRSAPVVRPSTRIATLAQGDRDEKLAAADTLGWWRVAATVAGERVEGFAAHRSLEPLTDTAEPPPITGAAPAVHFEENRPDIRRARDGGRAYPLGEPGRPRPPSGDGTARADGLRAIVDWLLVERSARYLPKPATTYCNIYAHDVCYLAGVYLPRVWWTGRALARGEAVPPRSGATVRELNADAPCDWLDDHGPDLGRRRRFALDGVQAAANAGSPRHPRATHRSRALRPHQRRRAGARRPRASRRGGTVERPLQSQAGRHNFAYDTGSRRWWLADDFAEFGFWIHER